MSFERGDPGPCPICGAAHTACTGIRGPVVVRQLPARDAAAGELEPVPMVEELAPPRLQAEVVQETLPAGQVTTGTYRRKKGRR